MANLAKPLNQGFAAPSIVANYGPYNTVAAAHAALAEDRLNVVGMTVGIKTGNTIEEYWYQGGTAQSNLVPKKPALAPVATSGSYNDLTDKPTIPAPVDISGKADKSEMSITQGTGVNADKTTIQLKSGTSATVLTQHQDITGKADKITTYTKTEVNTAIALANSAINTALAEKANTADVETSLATKQDTINDLATIRSGAALGATAQQPATTLAGYGITDAYTKAEGQALETQVSAAINSVQDTVELLNGSDVVVVANHTAVTSPDGQKIYREQGNNSYTDWMYQDSSWKEIATYTMPGIDNAPTKNSSKLVDSGGVFKAIQDDAVFDVSAHNLDLNQNPTPYESLALALAAVPTDYKKGGMNIKFIKTDTTTNYGIAYSTGRGAVVDAINIDYPFTIADGNSYSANNILSVIGDSLDKDKVETAINSLVNDGDIAIIQCEIEEAPDQYSLPTYGVWRITKNVIVKRKYVRFSLTSTSWSDDVDDWQGVDDEPTAGSDNLVKSGGVEESIIKNIGDTSYKEFINLENIPDREKAIIANGNWGSSRQAAHKIIKVKAGERYIITANNEKNCEYAFLTDKTVTTDSQAAFVIGTSRNTIEKGISCRIVIPETCIYLYIVVSKSENNVAIPGFCPESLCRISFYGDDHDTLLLNIEQDLSNEQKKQVKHNIGIDADLYAIQNALQWQLCGMYGKAGIWMSDGQFTVQGSTYCVSYRKVYKGELIKCVVSQNATIGYCVSIPSEGGTYSLLADLTSTGETIVEILADGYICANFRKAFNCNVILYKLQLNNISAYFPHILEDIGLVDNTGLVVDQDSANYGNIVNVSNASFFTSDFINISSFKYIAIPVIYTTSSSINYTKDSYGAIFYDDNKEIVSVVDVTINPALVTSRDFAIFSKPSNAVYIRISTNGENYKKIIGYDTNQNSIDSSTVKTIVNESIAENSKTVSAKTIFELNPDTEMLSKMVSAKKKAVGSGTTENGPTPLTFAHISDVHGASTQFARFVEFAEHWKDEGYVDEIIDTGDCVLGTYGDAIAWRDNTEGVENILTVIGNHETRATTAEKSSSNYPNGQNEWQYHSNISLDDSKRNDMYNRYFIGSDSNNPYVSNWGVTQPSNAAINGLCYYYKDYTEQNIRLIGLDVMGYNETQDTWLRSVLADAITSNYHVVILAHFPGEVMTGLNCNYTSLFSSGSDRTTIDNYNSYAHNIPISVDNFQTAGGIFVGYICGHYHRDMVNVITNYPKQLVLSVSSGGRSPIRDFTKVEGCKSYDDFQIVTIQPYHKIVKLIKVGADIDYYMRKKSTLCVSYALVKDDGTEPGIDETATKIKGVIGEGA